MKSKKTVSYTIQTNLEGGFDVVQYTQQSKIVGHTDNEEAAKAIIDYLNKFNQ